MKPSCTLPLSAFATVVGLTCFLAQPTLATDLTFNFSIKASGTPTFETNDLAGNDSSATNNIIRTLDFITYKWDYVVNNGVANNVVLSAKVPANTELIMPTVCQTGSSITNNATTGEQTITCRVGNVLSGSTSSIDLKARVLTKERSPSNNYVANQNRTNATGSIAADNITNTPSPITTPDLVISAKPKVDLYKQSAYIESIVKGTDGVTDGFLIRYPIVIAAMGGGKGIEALQNPLRFTDQLVYNGGPNNGQAVPGVKIYNWRPGGTATGCARMGGDTWSYYNNYPNGKIGVSANTTSTAPAVSTADSGTWTCTQAGSGQPINVQITGADTSGIHAPTKDFRGVATLPADQAMLAVGALHLWVPISSVTNAGGQLNVRNQLSTLQAIGAGGQANTEPSTTNNYWNHTLVSISGSLSSYYSLNVDNRTSVLPGMSAIYGGDGPVMPKQIFAERVILTNNGALAWKAGAILCTAIDNQTQELVPLTPGIAVKNFSNSGTLGVDYVIEYGTGDYATPLDQKKATCRDQDSPTGWTTILPADPSTVTKIRVRGINSTPVGRSWDIALNLRARSHYLNTGTSIPIGTRLVQHTSFYLPDNPNPGQGTPGMPPLWSGGYYQPDTNNSVGWGDRLTMVYAIVRVDKQNVPNQEVKSMVAGAQTTFLLKSTVTLPVSIPNVSAEVVLKDILPATLRYVEGSASFPPTSVVNNADGTTTLTWNFGARVPGQTLPDITFDAIVRPDTPNNSTLINTAMIESPEDASDIKSRTDTVSLNVGNATVFQIFKETPKVLLDLNEKSVFHLFYANVGSSDVPPSQFIDIFPYVGDARTPATAYTGTYTFDSITGSNGETFEFTSRPPSQIHPDPTDASNQAGGATVWCNAAQFGAPGCPSGNNAVTAVRIMTTIFPKSTPTRKVVLTLQPNGNAYGNIYTNRFTGRATSLLGLLESKDVDVRIAFPSNLLLVKRITAINGSPIATVLDDPNTTNDNHPAWSNGYLKGSINGGIVKPGDELEYTIYYLSTGDYPAVKVKFCDLVPSNTTYLPTAFNSLTPKAVGGLSGADRGIQVMQNSATQYFTGVADGDAATFFAPGTQPAANCSGANTNGAVVVNLGTVIHSGYGGYPANAYGSVRFRAKVK